VLEVSERITTRATLNRHQCASAGKQFRVAYQLLETPNYLNTSTDEVALVKLVVNSMVGVSASRECPLESTHTDRRFTHPSDRTRFTGYRSAILSYICRGGDYEANSTGIRPIEASIASSRLQSPVIFQRKGAQTPT
jgi:hypothetical protein